MDVQKSLISILTNSSPERIFQAAAAPLPAKGPGIDHVVESTEEGAEKNATWKKCVDKDWCGQGPWKVHLVHLFQEIGEDAAEWHQCHTLEKAQSVVEHHLPNSVFPSGILFSLT